MGRAPIKVLHLMNGAGGGAALSTLGLIERHRQRGIASCVVCDASGTAEERAAISRAVDGEAVFTPLYWWNPKIRSKFWKRPAIELRQWLRTGLRAAEIAMVARAARRFGAELIHTNTILTPSGGHAARLLGLPHVWHLREMLGPGQPFQLPLAGARLGRYLEEHASFVVANSNASAEALRPVVSPERLVVVPNGISLTTFASLRARAHSSPVMGMVANLTSKWKKHLLFIEAARQAPGAEYRLYGHAPEPGRDAYADEVRAACDRAGVKLMGFVDATELLQDLDVLVHTADGESFGRTVVEAMAVGLPVIGVDGGGVGETVVHEETGLLAPPDSARELAALMRRLIGDAALRRRLGAAGKARAMSEYSIEACGDRIVEVYKAAMGVPVESGLTLLSKLGALW